VEVIPGRTEILARLAAPDFDFRRRVLLEGACDPLPEPGGAAGRAAVVEESTDHMIVEAEVSAPALLLITDAYHPFWTAESLPGSAQAKYEILPANWALRAVPLQAGRHRIRLEYRVPGLGAAMTVSLLAAVALIVLGAAVVFRRRSVDRTAGGL
jgi:hypothetical protein